MTILIIYYTRRQGVPNSTNLLLCCIFLPLLFLATMPHHSFVFFERKNETSWSAAVLCSPFLPSDVENGQQPCGSVVEFPLFGVACGLLPSTPSTWELLRHQGELITLPNKVGTFRSTQKHQEPNHHNKRRRRRRGWQYQTPQSDSAQLAFLRLNNRAFHRQWPSYISARLYTRVHRKR